MKHVQKASRRLVRQLKAVDKKQLRLSLEDLLKSYGIYGRPLFGLPAIWSVCDERIYSASGDLLYATATRQMPTFYVPGIMRGARKAPFELVLLHTHCHELIHYLGQRTLDKATLREKGRERTATVEKITSVSGFQIETKFTSDIQSYSYIFHFFNEGVTEMVGRELFRTCIYRLGPRNVSPEQIDAYVNTIDEHGFYQPCVRFVEALVVKFALTAKVLPKTVLDWLVRAYVEGTDLRQDPVWRTFVEHARLPGNFTKQLENATVKDLESFQGEHLVRKIKVNPVFGHDFDDIEIV